MNSPLYFLPVESMKRHKIGLTSLITLISIGIGIGWFFVLTKESKIPEISLTNSDTAKKWHDTASVSKDSVTETSTTLSPEKNKVVFLFPSGAVENLDQSVLVSFASPATSLKTLDQKSDCPLKITPSVNGTCKWISTQTVEFTPEWWKPATKYTITIPSSGTVTSGTFTTPMLRRYVWAQESLHDGILIVFNFPVKMDELKTLLQVKEGISTIAVNIKEWAYPGAYLVTPQKWFWKYLTQYTFSLQ